MMHSISNQLAAAGVDPSRASGEPSLSFRAPAEPAAEPGLEKTTSTAPVATAGNAIDAVNRSLEAWSTGIRFEMDEEAQRLVVSVIDSNTGEVLRTIPSDAVLKVARMIVQLQGTGVDTHA